MRAGHAGARENSELQALAGALTSLDRMVHKPSRLAILTILRRNGESNYLLILRLTGLSKGNLSNHLAKLEEAGLVDIGKRFEGNKPLTAVRLTNAGRAVIEGYWGVMESIARRSRESSGADAACSMPSGASAVSCGTLGHEGTIHAPILCAGPPERASATADESSETSARCQPSTRKDQDHDYDSA